MPVLSSMALPANERGTLLVVVLIILLVTTLLGLSAMKATGMEMRMSSNSREQLMLLEAAEYVVAKVTNEIRELGGFSNNSLANDDCGTVCFDENCTGGYCFFGAATGDASSWKSCATGLPVVEPSQEAAVWSDDSGRHNKLAVPHTTVPAKYVIEFRCYAAIDDSLAMDDANNTKAYRITALVSSESGRSTVMLRVTMKDL